MVRTILQRLKQKALAEDTFGGQEIDTKAWKNERSVMLPKAKNKAGI